MTEEKSVRYRINIKETAKKDKYWECTVEMIGYTEEAVLAASASLVAELEKRYPPPTGDNK